MCKVKSEHNNKWKAYEIFVVPGNGQTMWGMPDIETLDVLTINCNTTELQTQREQIHSKMENK